MQKRIKLTIEDTLSFYNDYVGDYVVNENNIKTIVYFIKVPLDWLEHGQLTSTAIEKFYAFLYGENWRNGNGDGSRYLPLKATVQFLAEEGINEWFSKNHFYIGNENGTISTITPQEF